MALLYFVVLDAKIYRYRVKGTDHMLLLKLGVVLLSSEIGEDEKISYIFLCFFLFFPKHLCAIMYLAFLDFYC